MLSNSFPLVLGLGYTLSGLTSLSSPRHANYFIISSILIPPTAVLLYKFLKNKLWQWNTFCHWIVPTPIEALDYILQRAKPTWQDVIKYFDEFCWKVPMMNFGDVKGKIGDMGVKSALGGAKGEFKMLELGSYCGQVIGIMYSTIRFAGVMRDYSASEFSTKMVYAVDPDGLSSAVAAKLIWHAGLTEYVTPVYKTSDQAIHEFLREKIKFDCVLLDHAKDLYLNDLKMLLEYGLLNPNCVIIADNIVYPGVPDYKDFMLKGDGKQLFETVVHDTTVAYSNSKKDQIFISVYKG